MATPYIPKDDSRSTFLRTIHDLLVVVFVLFMLLVLMPPLPVFPFHLVVEPVKVDVRVMPELQPVPVGLVLASIPGMVFMPVFVINSSFALLIPGVTAVTRLSTRNSRTSVPLNLALPKPDPRASCPSHCDARRIGQRRGRDAIPRCLSKGARPIKRSRQDCACARVSHGRSRWRTAPDPQGPDRLQGGSHQPA